MSLLPPDLPPNSIYTSCWCEENVYILCSKFLADDAIVKSWEPFVLVISNHSKTVALWSQKAAREDHLPVVWDYHVVLVLRARNPSHHLNLDSLHSPDQSGGNLWVYDFDTTMPIPCPWEDYLSATFPVALTPQYQSLFRIIPGTVFINYFASDRSHMLLQSTSIASDGESVPQLYHSPPPSYKPLCGTAAAKLGISNNLMEQFVCMSTDKNCYGEVVTLDRITFFLSSHNKI